MIKISIILPTYNCAPYIEACIDSLLYQTFQDFELLIVDDCSTDDTVAKINSYSDTRIALTIKKENTGYTDSLNWAVGHAKGKYIARMDADDVCYPERLEKQVRFLENHPNVDMLGTTATILGTEKYLKNPSAHAKVKTNLLFGSALVHPSVMGRAEVFKKFPYDRTTEPAEDYDLWTRIATQGELANLEEPLLYYRVHPGQISTVKKEKQDKSAQQSMLRMFKLLNDPLGINDSTVLTYIWPQGYKSFSEIVSGCDWFKGLTDTDCHFDRVFLKEALSRKRYNLLKYYIDHPHLVDNPRRVTLEFLKQFPILGSKYLAKRL